MTPTTYDRTASLSLDQRLIAAASKHKLLLPYVTAGVREDWLDLVEAIAEAGADAIEIAIPFSDPSLDGATIQQASTAALARGTTPLTVLREVAGRQIGVPLIIMTYYNLVFRAGLERFAHELASAGITGSILPDLPLELADDWQTCAEQVDIGHVLMAAPVTPLERVRQIGAATHGFVYTVSMMGTTGEREVLGDDVGDVIRRVKSATDRLVVLGFGVSTAEHASIAAQDADGVIVASALMRRVLDGASVEETASLVSEMRHALDAAPRK